MRTHLSRCNSTTEGGRTSSLSIYVRSHMTVIPNWDISCNLQNSNCHVLRKNTTVDYEHKGGAPKDFVRVCGVRRFQRGLDEIKKHISDHGIRADFYTRELN